MYTCVTGQCSSCTVADDNKCASCEVCALCTKACDCDAFLAAYDATSNGCKVHQWINN